MSPGCFIHHHAQEIVMLRKSGLLAIALSLATLVYASAPAAAGFTKTPQVAKAYNPHLRTTVGRSYEPMWPPVRRNPFN
jgi:hypothetical protein